MLRKKAEMYLDLTYAVIAEETLLTTRGGPKSRVKVGHEYDGGHATAATICSSMRPDARTRRWASAAHSTSNYYPPPAIVNLAKDTTGRGTYAFTKRWPGPVAEGGGRSADDPDGVLWRTLDPERSVLRYGFATPNYVIGSAGLDATWLDDTSMGFRWQGVVFASDPLARIGFEVKPANRNDWHGFNPFFSVQDRNILITQKWAPVPPNPRTANAGLPARVLQPDARRACRKRAAGFSSRTAAPSPRSRSWRAATNGRRPGSTPTASEKDNKAFITLDTENAPVILIANQAADYKQRFRGVQGRGEGPADPLRGRRSELCHDHLLRPRPSPAQVDGQAVNLAPSRGYDSPFIRSDWNSGLIYIRKGDDTADPRLPGSARTR